MGRKGDKITEAMEAGQPAPISKSKAPNPWKFVPILYLLQAVPVVFIQDVTAVMFKDLGVPNDTATMWVSLLAVPWSLQIVLGPLVELSSKRRNWVVKGQVLMALLFGLLPFLVLAFNQALVVSVVYMFAMGVLSALINIATDGFYIIALSKDVQSAFVGLQSAFFRLGRMIPSTLILIIVGNLMSFSPIKVATEGNLYFSVKGEKEQKIGYMKSAEFSLKQGQLVTPEGKSLLDSDQKPVTVGGEANKIEIQNGILTAGSQKTNLGLYQINRKQSNVASDDSFAPTNYPTPDLGTLFTGGSSSRKLATPVAWMLGLAVLFLAYGALVIGAARFTPHADQDTEPTEEQQSQLKPNILRTIIAVATFIPIFHGLNSGLKALLNGISWSTRGVWLFPDDTDIFRLLSRVLPGDPDYFSGMSSPLVAELITFGISAVALSIVIPFMRSQVKGSEIGASLGAFFRQPGIIAILCFMMFYRFAEAMVNRISPVFLKDDLTLGGLALDTGQVGWVKGTIGPIGIILGGLVGGFLIKQIGMKRGFWIVALVMHLPIFLYLGAAIMQPRSMWGISAVEFIDQFGYGVGYSGYAVILMGIAQRGKYPTAHYAIGAGLGAAIIVFAGMTASNIFAAVTPKIAPTTGHAPTYVIAFTVALICAIPGLLTLFFLPTLRDTEPEQPAAA